MRIQDPGSGMETVLIRDPGWKKVDPGSGINIPDPQHCLMEAIYSLIANLFLVIKSSI
jgi:hypothetical protein